MAGIGGLKLWECTIDLVETLRREIQDGQLSFRGKRVLEVSSSYYQLNVAGLSVILCNSAESVKCYMVGCSSRKNDLLCASCSVFRNRFYSKCTGILSVLTSTNILTAFLMLLLILFLFFLQLGCGHGLPGIFACLKVRYTMSIANVSSKSRSGAGI